MRLLKNSTVGILVGSRSEPCYDNVIDATVRASASLGINLSPSSVRTAIRGVVSDTPVGIKVDPGAVGTVVAETFISSCNTALSLSADTDCHGIVITQAPEGVVEQVSIGTGAVRMRGCRIMLSPVGPLAMQLYSGSLDLDQCTLTLPTNGIGIYARGGAVVRVGSGVSITGHGPAGFALFASNATIMVAAGADIPHRAIGSGANGLFNFGTARIGTDGVVMVTFPRLGHTDLVVLTQVAGEGSYTMTQTPGTGFRINGTAGDSFAWKVT